MKNTNTETPCDIEHDVSPAIFPIGATARNELK
jgi:hypothetical protein